MLPVDRYLYGFEEYCRSASITFRTIHHNNPRPPTTQANQKLIGAELQEPATPPEAAVSVNDKMEAESESESEKEEVKERQLSPRVRHSFKGEQLRDVSAPPDTCLCSYLVLF